MSNTELPRINQSTISRIAIEKLEKLGMSVDNENLSLQMVIKLDILWDIHENPLISAYIRRCSPL